MNKRKNSTLMIEKIKEMPLIAILRGLEVSESVEIAKSLVEAGFTTMEITLNSPNAYESIKQICQYFGDEIALGAGTVLHTEEVFFVKEAGGKFIISPNMNISVIEETKKLGLLSIPGCYTPTEVFAAQKAGADIIKIFPAESLGLPYLKAIKAVLPKETRICPTGGVNSHNLKSFFEEAQVFAIGIGSSLYKKGKSPKELKKDASELVRAFQKVNYQ